MAKDRRIVWGWLLILCLLLAACASPAPQPTPVAVQPTRTATTTPTASPTATPTRIGRVFPTITPHSGSLTDTIRHSLSLTRYAEPPAHLHTIISLLNQGEEAQRIVVAELMAHAAPHLPPTQPLTGSVFADADLNGDGAMERLVVSPGESQMVPSLLGITVRDTDGHHTLTTIESFSSNLVIRIQEVADINQDGEIEIVVQAAGCAPRAGCFLGVRVLRWDDEEDELVDLLWTLYPGRDERAGAALNSAQAMLTDADSDGIQEIVLTGGDDTAYTEWVNQIEGDMPDAYSGRAVGPQRVCSRTHAWDGTRYLYADQECDPDASRHPWFRLHDGDDALARGELATAIGLYRDALSHPHPQNVRFDRSTPEDQARLFAVLRFRLMLALVLQGEAEQAAMVVQEAQDGALATLTQTFWDAYQHTSDVQAGCTAARAAAEELEDPYIRGYQRVYTLPGIRARLCQDTDPLPASR